MITLTIRGILARRPGRHLRELVIDAELRDALDALHVDFDVLENDLAVDAERAFHDQPADQYGELPFTLAIHIGDGATARQVLTFAEGLPRCTGCETLLGPDVDRATCDWCVERCVECDAPSPGARWCAEHRPACLCCGKPACDLTPEDCAEHAAQAAAFEMDAAEAA